MNRITHTLVVCFALILLSCSSNNKRKSTHEQGNVFVANNVTNISFSSVYFNSKAIDFFGVEMLGGYNDKVDGIYALPMLSLIELRDTMKNETMM